MGEDKHRKAPNGFTPELWETFVEDGLIVIEDALSASDVEFYLNTIDQCCSTDPKFDPGKFYGPNNVVERFPALKDLIDHPRHLGFAYDLYGELLKLHISQIFVRPRDSSHNAWHPDGARVVPYGVFTAGLPLQIKISYWLTDLPDARMGNFVYMPGSHRSQVFDHYTTHDSVMGEKVLRVPRGAMTIAHCDTWHRVEPNESENVRKNIFLAYCPSWICEADRHRSDSEWLKTLNREQRIIMRSYEKGYNRTKPPKEDFPLFLDRESGLDHDIGTDLGVPLGIRKRRTKAEELGG